MTITTHGLSSAAVYPWVLEGQYGRGSPSHRVWHQWVGGELVFNSFLSSPWRCPFFELLSAGLPCGSQCARLICRRLRSLMLRRQCWSLSGRLWGSLCSACTDLLLSVRPGSARENRLLWDPRILHQGDTSCPSCLSLVQCGDNAWDFCFSLELRCQQRLRMFRRQRRWKSYTCLSYRL